MNWIFLNTGFRSGKFNMEYDEFLATRLVGGHGSPCVRVYGWNPPAISIGYNQNLDDIDIKRCESAGIDVVRRPTGGRAILHWNELTYSVIMFSEKMSISQIYEKISRAIVEGLNLLGVEVQLEKSQPNFQKFYKTTASIPCFSSSARYEIQHNGRKLVGSAQRRYTLNEKEVVLQHGSILIGPEHKSLIDFLNEKNTNLLNIMKKNLDEHTTDLMQILNREVSYGEVAEAIKIGFEKNWSLNFLDAEKQITRTLT